MKYIHKLDCKNLLTIGLGIGSILYGHLMVVRATKENPAYFEFLESKKETQKDLSKKEQLASFSENVVETVKVFGPGAAVSTIGVGLLVSGAMSYRKNMIETALVGGLIDHQFRQYRNRVIDTYGLENEGLIQHNIKKETLINKSSGNEEIRYINNKGGREYFKFFDESSPHWEKESSKNLAFLLDVERKAKTKLASNSLLSLGDLCELLGVRPEIDDYTVGWRIDRRDNFTLDLFNPVNPGMRDFINGYTNVALFRFSLEKL